MPNSQFRVDCDLVYRDVIEDFLLSQKSFMGYYISFEISSKTSKPHWQGWVEHTCTENRYGVLCRLWITENFPTHQSHQYCFGKIKDFPVYQAYIIQNPVKDYIDHVTSYDPEYLSGLELPSWVPPVEYKKKRANEFAADMIDGYRLILDRALSLGGVPTSGTAAQNHVLNYVIHYFQGHSKCHDEIVLYRFYNMLMSQFYHSEHRRDMLEKLKKKIYID